jgi:methylglutaconyl-CoA hydratase
MYQLIECTIKDRVGYITLNRVENGNALNELLIAELKHAVLLAEQTPEVKIVIINAKGGVFSEGLEVGELQKLQNESLERNFEHFVELGELYKTIYRASKIYVAQIEGNAFSTGLGLANVCDFAFAVPEAKFAFREVKLGLVPAVISYFLLRKVGEMRTKEILLGGDLLSSQQAVDYQLINQIISKEEIHSFVFDFAQKLVRENADAALALTKKLIADMQLFPIEEGVAFSAKMSAYNMAGEEAKLGIMSLVNQQTKEW